MHNKQSEEGITKTFKATGESSSGTKTALSGNQVLWSEGDCISIFNAACPAGEEYSIAPGDSGKGEASFTGTDIGAGPWYSLYPIRCRGLSVKEPYLSPFPAPRFTATEVSAREPTPW